MTIQLVIALIGLLGTIITGVWTTIQITDFMRRQRERREAEARQAQAAERPADDAPGERAATATAPAAARQTPPGNLPRPITSFIGREREREEVARLLETTRLLTLTGPGGTGKTRLALEVGRDLRGRYADGVWLVELAALRDESLVPQAVATALGVAERPEHPLMEALTEHLRERSLLLILDNCEHLITACAQIATTLLRAAPRVTILATSRQALGTAGETVWRVPSLDAPNPQVIEGADELLAFDAAKLFVDRAAAANPAFTLTDRSVEAVAQICQRLDGIPLALELAAAQVRALSVEQIAARLDDRFRLLTRGNRAALPRQQTLQALIDWSHDLLDEQERAFLRRLAVFAGGFDVEAAESVTEGEAVNRADALGLLTSLVDKSLVTIGDGVDGAPRYRLLESIRAYAAEKLDAAGEGPRARDRHLDWYVAVAERAEPELTGGEQVGALRHLEEEHDNLRAALDWGLSIPAGMQRAARMAVALCPFWSIRGYLSEGRSWLERAIAATDAGADPAGTDASAPVLRLRALNAAGALAEAQGDYDDAAGFLDQALDGARGRADERLTARALQQLGNLAYRQGDYARARELYSHSLELRRRQADEASEADLLTALGSVALALGEYEESTARLQEGLAVFRRRGNKQGIAGSLAHLTHIALQQGDYARAATLAEESLALRRDLGHTQGIAQALTSLATIADGQGEHDRAATLQDEALTLYRELGDKKGAADSLVNLGIIAYRQGNLARATELLGESLPLHRELGDKQGVAATLGNLAIMAQEQGDSGRAVGLFRESVELNDQLGARVGVAHALDGLAAALAATGEFERSAVLYGAAGRLFEEVGATLEPHDKEMHDRSVATVRDAVGEDRWHSAWSRGRAMAETDAIAYALAKPMPA